MRYLKLFHSLINQIHFLDLLNWRNWRNPLAKYDYFISVCCMGSVSDFRLESHIGMQWSGRRFGAFFATLAADYDVLIQNQLH